MNPTEIRRTLYIIAGDRPDKDSQLEYVAKKADLVSRLILKDNMDKDLTSSELRKCAMIIRNAAKSIRDITQELDNGGD